MLGTRHLRATRRWTSQHKHHGRPGTYGIPVVSTNVGGVPHLVEHEKTALLVPAQDPEAMAEAVLSLLNNPLKTKRMINAGLESVQQYTWPKVRDSLFRVYGNVLENSNESMVRVK